MVRKDLNKDKWTNTLAFFTNKTPFDIFSKIFNISNIHYKTMKQSIVVPRWRNSTVSAADTKIETLRMHTLKTITMITK